MNGQTHGRSVEDPERVRRLVVAFALVVAHLGELGHELDALRLASRERRARLAARRMSRADLPVRHVADELAAPANDERFSAEAPAATGFDAEAEARRHMDTRLRLRRLGEELAELVPRATAATRRPNCADRLRLTVRTSAAVCAVVAPVAVAVTVAVAVAVAV